MLLLLKSHKLFSFLLQLFNFPNIDQMYKEMKKIQTGNRSIVEVGNGDRFYRSFFFFGIKKC
jgi:hypothetical protein